MRRLLPTRDSRRSPAASLEDSVVPAASLEEPEDAWEWVGDPNASILVAGHSHANAYRLAVIEGLTTEVAVLWPKTRVDRPAIEGTPVPRDASYWGLARSFQGRVLAVPWNGNQHTSHFLFDFDERLRLHDSGDLGTVVPASMISAFWEHSLAPLEDFCGSVQAEKFVLLGTPPPKSEEAIRAGVTREALLVKAIAEAGETVETIRITPTAVRVGLWKILQSDLEAWATRIGAVFVSVPASAQTADGCLKPEYSFADASHANGAFGALMFGEIEAALAQAAVAQR